MLLSRNIVTGARQRTAGTRRERHSPIHSFQFVKGPPGTLPRQIRNNLGSCPSQVKNLVLVCPGSVVGARPKVFAAATPSENRYLMEESRLTTASITSGYSPVRPLPVTPASQRQFAVVSIAELPDSQIAVSACGTLTWRVVPGGGVEPPRPEGRRILSPLRLPVPPSRPG